MFGKLADVIAKHYRAIIILWVILFLPAIFLAPQIGSVLIYEETNVPAPEMPSTQAQDFIDQSFGSASSGTSTIVVLQNRNILDNESKQAVFAIEDGVLQGKHTGRLPENTTIITVYQVVEAYAAQYLMGVHQAYYLVNESVMFTRLMLFGLPDAYRALWFESNATAFVVYGVPYIHVQVWSQLRQANPGWTVPMVDSATYNASVPAMMSSVMYQGLSHDMQALARGWHQAYSLAWNATSSVPELASFPYPRSQAAIDATFPSFLYSLPLPEGEKPFLEGVHGSFDLYTWSDFHALSHFSCVLFIDEVDAIIGGVEPEERQVVDLYLNLFYGSWNASASLPGEQQFQGLAGASVGSLASAVGGPEGELFLAVYHGLGWDDWLNTTAMRQLVIGLVSAESGADPWVVAELSSFPEDGSYIVFVAFANRLTRDFPLDQFPVPVIKGLIALMVNTPTNDTMLLTIDYGKGVSGTDHVTTVRSLVTDASRGRGVGHFVTGSDPLSYDLETSTNEDIERIDPVTIFMILVLVGLFFRSLVAPSMPPMVIGVALGMSISLIVILGTYLLDVHYSVLPLLVVASLGAGCDYCIFLLSRYREERRKGLEKEEAVRTAVTWAGESITTSGITVIIGFGVLSLGSYWVIRSMGVALALGLTIALLAALTLLPAVLMLLGDRMFWPATMKAPPAKAKEGYFVRAAKLSIKHAKVIVVAAMLVSVPTTYLALTLDTSYDFIAAMPDVESKQGLEAMEEGFGAGKITPTQIALNMSHPVYADGNFSAEMLASVENLCSDLAAMENVQSVQSPTRPLGSPIDYSNISMYPPLQQADLKVAMRAMVGTNNTNAVLIAVVFRQEPFSTDSIESIQMVREQLAVIVQEDPDILGGFVGGATPQMHDISNMMAEEFTTMELLVIIGIYIVLMVVLGSIVSPARSILTILLSISWTLALTMVVFQFTWGMSILWLLPTVLLVICLGLGMDYDIFITTRIREEVAKGRETNDAIIHAMEQTGGIITACGIIMASAFGTLMLSQGALLQQFGFALAFAILLDATVVRIYLVPAIISLLGKWNWYAPGRLQRTGRESKRK